MSAAVDSARIESLFDWPTAAAELQGTGDPDALFPEEKRGQQRWATKRVNEFAAGRQCAHRALQKLGVAASPLIAQPDRRPAWPSGTVGSITHCAGFGAAVVALASTVRSVGLDAELEQAVEPRLWPRVLNKGEQEWVLSQPSSEQRRWATAIFSAKEAFYKCQFPVTGSWLDFADARVEVRGAAQPGCFSLVTRSQSVILSGKGFHDGHIVCTAFCWPAASPP